MTMKRLGAPAIVTAALLAIAAPAWASGGGSVPMGGGSGMGGGSARMTKEQQAAMQYNNGLKQQEKGDKLSAEAESATEPKAREKLSMNARKAYDKARGSFENAIKKDAEMHQAHAGLGYVKRKLGDYDGSLAAYDRALELQPGYTPAIEYRAEAYLGLGRVEEAKAGYMQLFTADRKRADELATAMSKWVESKKADPAGVDPGALEEFTGWLNQRLEIAKQTAVLLPAKETRW